MKLCFLIYSYFPYGGQQRDFMRIARQCCARDHEIIVYTLKWEGPRPDGLDVRLVPVRARSRPKLYERFTGWVQAELLKERYDCVVGFNKMPGLDVYYAADPCFAEKAAVERGWYYRFTARYRHFMAYEEAVFGPDSHTQVLLLSPLQQQQFSHHYPGCEARLHRVPPGVNPDRKAPDNAQPIRAALRRELGLSEQHHAVLQIGSGFVVKGVDRSLRAIAALPHELRQMTHYLLVGQDKAARFKRLARKLGIADQCHFLGGRDDVPRFLLGCDLLLHPAYSESAGYVLLEATVAGLPVLTTDTCGYAFHIEQAGSGQICASPFSQQDLNHRLQDMLLSEKRSQWRQQGIRYGREADLYSMPEAATRWIEKTAGSKVGHLSGAAV